MKVKHIILKKQNIIDDFNTLKGGLISNRKMLVSDEKVIEYLMER